MKKSLFLLLLAIDILLLAKPVFAPEKDAVKMIFVGDIFLDRYIRQAVDKKGGDYIFNCVDGLLKDVDLVVGNLEGPITDSASRSLGTIPGSPDNFVFTFPTSSADLLYSHNIKVVNLGNNHISNFGQDGIEQTKKYLKSAGVSFFGGLAGDEPIYRTKVNGQKITLISYNQFGGDPASAVVEKIKKEKKEFASSTIIVYTHWGEEYVEPTERTRAIAKDFSTAGASVIIGSHPHVVQSSEIIGGALVYYSLGNFIFDQYWDESVRKGLAVELTISKGKIIPKEHLLTLNPTGQTCLK
jgi:gamma-polyglutamate biosynthesis protein CapA